jgi:SPP1 family predicted phage head-tail adaptor
MRTGQFKHWITFLLNEPTQDPNNGDLLSDEGALASMWAKVTPMTGSRALNAGQILNGKPYEIQVRYRDDIVIDEDLTIQWGNKRIAIHSVVEQDAEGTLLLITGTEVK